MAICVCNYSFNFTLLLLCCCCFQLYLMNVDIITLSRQSTVHPRKTCIHLNVQVVLVFSDVRKYSGQKVSQMTCRVTFCLLV